MTSGLLGVRHAALAVSDLPRARAFYVETLGFEPAYVSDHDWAMLSMAETTLSLVPVPNFTPLKLNDGGAHPAHLGITLASIEDVDALYQRLRYSDVPQLAAPKLHRDGSYGFYLTDLDGNALECIFIPYRLQGASAAPPGDAAVVFVAMGEDAPALTGILTSLLARFRRHAVDIPVGLAYVADGHPAMSDVIPGLLAQRAVSTVNVVPVSLTPVTTQIANVLVKAKQAFPNVSFVVSQPLGEDNVVQEAIIHATITALGKG